jgi:hypothetical protein
MTYAAAYAECFGAVARNAPRQSRSPIRAHDCDDGVFAKNSCLAEADDSPTPDRIIGLGVVPPSAPHKCQCAARFLYA